jgi:cation/acetate symporter
MAAPLLAQFLGGGPDSMLGNLMLVVRRRGGVRHDRRGGRGPRARRGIRDEPRHLGRRDKGRARDRRGRARALHGLHVIVGALAIVIGILAQGQNVAHLVALAFAVAASANLPVVLLTLYWKRCNTGGVVLGPGRGHAYRDRPRARLPEHDVSVAGKAAQQKVIDVNTPRIAKLNADLAATTDPAAQDRIRKDLAGAEKGKAAAEGTIANLGSDRTSLVGLEKPLFELRNPGLISIPIGFIAVLLGSLMYRDRRAQDMWDELYVRSNTGIGRAAAAAH